MLYHIYLVIYHLTKIRMTTKESNRKYPKLHTSNLAQELYTPPSATQQIIPFIPKWYTVWEMCYWQWHLANELKKNWIDVVGWEGLDCFEYEPEMYDMIITNPPYRNNKDFLERAFDSWKPFALLMRLEHIGWVRASKMLKNKNIKILIPEKRINFITPKMRGWEKVWWSPFHTIRITFNLIKDSRQIIYL